MLARPAQGAATTVDMRCLSSVADARTSVTTLGGGLLHALHIIRLFAACEAGTRHGHYNWRWFGADARTSVPTVRMCEELMLIDCSLVADARKSVPTVRGGGLLHALHIIRLFAGCEAGTRRGHYSGYSLLVFGCGRSNERPYCQGVDCCMRYILFACSLLARPAQGAATTVDIRCLTDACGRSNERPYCQGVDYCMRYILFACSLLARPAQGAATTVDIRCLTDACGRSNERPYCQGVDYCMRYIPTPPPSSSQVLILSRGVEARARLEPLRRFYAPVTVHVG